jgi:peptidyl-prolyl cis-trans isomerase D
MDLTFSFNDLESVAKELDLAQKETSYFSRSSSTGELDYKTVKDMIFGDQQIQEGSLSEVIEVSDGMAFIVQVSDFRPQALKSFIEVESEVTSALKLSLANTKLQSEVQESLNKSKEGVDLESIASSKELELVSYKALARNSSLLPNNVIAEVFGMPRSALSEGTAAAYFENGDSIVYRLDKVNESKSVISSEEKEGFKAYILSERGLAELSDLQDAAYKSATVIRKSTQPLQ